MREEGCKTDNIYEVYHASFEGWLSKIAWGIKLGWDWASYQTRRKRER
jgi:hypothetical protein